MNRAAFFAEARVSLFSGGLNQSQVDGIEAITGGFERAGLTDLRWLAYMLATTFHETDRTMQPIVEYGGRKYFDKYDTGRLAEQLGNTPEADGDGYLYRGRGFVQITGFDNYEKFGLEKDPDKALDLPTAVNILILGMTRGMFTGRKLSDYFSGELADWVNARRIINGTDRAEEIGAKGWRFYQALEA
nr:hypothetical protein [Rhizobium sp. AG855]